MTKKFFLIGIVLALIMFFVGNAWASFTDPVGVDSAVREKDKVVVRLVGSDLVEFPKGKLQARIEDMRFKSPTLQLLFTATGAEKVARTYPGFTAEDTVIMDLAGQECRIGDLTRIITVDFKTTEQAEEFLRHCKTPESLKEEMNLWNRIIKEKNLGKAAPAEISKELNKYPRVQELKQRHHENPEIVWAEPTYSIKYQYAPNDPRLPQQWNMLSSNGINAIGAWNLVTTSNLAIAILDQGIHTHRDITFTGYQTGIYAHGLACAGIAGAKTDNGLDMAGIAWNTNFGSFNAGTSCPQTASAIYQAMGYCIMNLSLGATSESFELGTAVRTALNNGKLLCCASGNSGGSWPEYPGYWALSVGATKNNKQVAGYSCRRPDLVAPGGDGGTAGPEDILSLWYEDPYYHWWSGTSFACPHAAGVAALLYKELYDEQGHYYCTRSDLQNLMEKFATDRGEPGYDNYYGWGLIDAYDAVQAIQSSGPYRIKRESASSYNSYTESGAYAMTLVEVGGLATQTYLVKKNTMYRNVTWNHPCLETPLVWVNEALSNGWSSQNPQYGANWGDVEEGSVTTTGATLYTQIYHVWDVGGHECGWYPCERHEVSYNYSVLGHFNMFAPYNAVSQLIYDGGTSHYIRFMFADSNTYNEGYQVHYSHECGSGTVNLSAGTRMYNYYCPWGSVNVSFMVRPYIGGEYGPWSNVTTCRNAPNIPSNLRVSVEYVCGWPQYAKVTPGQSNPEIRWIPVDSMDLAPRPDGNDPPCFPRNKVHVSWDTPNYQYGEPAYYEVRVQMPTVPIQVYYIGPEYGHELEFCTWPNFGPQHISVLAWAYGLHSNKTQESKSITTGDPGCNDYPFEKGPPDGGREPLADKSGSLTRFSLFQNHPNPFNPNTEIRFALPVASTYTLKIYNVSGQLVKSYEGTGVASLNTITWDGRDNAGREVASGIYFYRLEAGEYSEVRKMILMK